jgi:hypothetical protein
MLSEERGGLAARLMRNGAAAMVAPAHPFPQSGLRGYGASPIGRVVTFDVRDRW